MAWRVAKSLEALLKQVNERWPNRSKASDGAKGDDKHAARPSDHNPNKALVVCARDFTHDPAHGLDARALADALIASKDSRIKYVISNGEIASGTGANHPAWKWRPYTGPNAHKKHVHVSVKGDKASYDSTKPWKIEPAVKKPAGELKLVEAPSNVIEPKPSPAPVPADDKERTKRVQIGLALLNYNPGGADGTIGPLTAGAIRIFRADTGLPEGSHIDDELIAALASAKPREMVAARANATPAQVAKAVPEAKSHAQNKLAAIGSGAVAVVGGAVNQLAPATGYLQPVKDFLGDIPTWAWVAAIVAVAGFIAWNSRKGQKAVDAAYRAGDRR